ncbi:MAG TPA: response regulator transcription factor [Pseudonocardiaceae bacterium]|nr:response regulator transcription factor [Pseudonocardiaceae bacterium]
MLLVDDDRELTELLDELLTDEGYQVDIALDGHHGLHLGLTNEYQVLVIDRGLPAIEGLDLLSRLRRKAVVARALILTAQGTLADRVAGLDAGADDYLVKPFEIDELLARIRALHRRHIEAAESIPIGAGELELSRRAVLLPTGDRITLSAKEFALLRLLAARPRTVHTRAELRCTVFADTAAESIVDTYVYYLRRKLGKTIVQTVHGLGYQMGVL